MYISFQIAVLILRFPTVASDCTAKFWQKIIVSVNDLRFLSFRSAVITDTSTESPEATETTSGDTFANFLDKETFCNVSATAITSFSIPAVNSGICDSVAACDRVAAGG